MSVKKAAQTVLAGTENPEQGLRNVVDPAFRAGDPCFGRAPQGLPGQMPLEITVRNPDGRIRHYVKRD